MERLKIHNVREDEPDEEFWATDTNESESPSESAVNLSLLFLKRDVTNLLTNSLSSSSVHHTMQ